MDETTKQQILKIRRMLQKNAPDTYRRFASLKMSRGEKHEDNKAVQSGTQDVQASLVATNANSSDACSPAIGTGAQRN